MSSKKANPQASDDVIQVRIAFDLKTNKLTLLSKANTTILLGILETAKMLVMEQQILIKLSLKSGEKPGDVIAPATSGQMPRTEVTK